jgi:hypothetical protein
MEIYADMKLEVSTGKLNKKFTVLSIYVWNKAAGTGEKVVKPLRNCSNN